MKIFLSTNMRDEESVLEWVAYHLLIGFTYILIVDNESKIPIKKIIENNNLGDKVTVRYYKSPNKKNNIKLSILNTIVKPYMVKQNADWFIHLDGDEYINLNNTYENISELIEANSTSNIIALNWVLFGTSNYDKQPKGLIIENFTKCSPKHNAIKCLVKTKAVINAPHSHFWNMKVKNKGVDSNGNQWKIRFANTKTKGINDKVYINHYLYQSYETYLNRKVKRKTDDGVQRGRMSKKEIHSLHNSRRNITLVKYAPKVKEYLLNLSSKEN